MLGLLEALSRWIVRVAMFLATAFLAIGVAINFLNAGGRYLFSAPISWADEIMLFLMIAGVFLGACAVTAENKHIRMDILVNYLPARLRRGFDVLGDILTIVVCGGMVAIAVPVIEKLTRFGQMTEAARIPIAIPQSVVPISFALIALLLIVRLLGGRRAPAPEHRSSIS
ncbi:MAG: TRAP transporter small permease [Alphaproteobacteria bacterium]